VQSATADLVLTGTFSLLGLAFHAYFLLAVMSLVASTSAIDCQATPNSTPKN